MTNSLVVRPFKRICILSKIIALISSVLFTTGCRQSDGLVSPEKWALRTEEIKTSENNRDVFTSPVKRIQLAGLLYDACLMSRGTLEYGLYVDLNYEDFEGRPLIKDKLIRKINALFEAGIMIGIERQDQRYFEPFGEVTKNILYTAIREAINSRECISRKELNFLKETYYETHLDAIVSVGFTAKTIHYALVQSRSEYPVRELFNFLLPFFVIIPAKGVVRSRISGPITTLLDPEDFSVSYEISTLSLITCFNSSFLLAYSNILTLLVILVVVVLLLNVIILRINYGSTSFKIPICTSLLSAIVYALVLQPQILFFLLPEILLGI